MGSGASTEALRLRVGIFYKVIKQTESVVSQNKRRASYL